MTEQLQRRAREMMQRDSNAGLVGASPLASIEQGDPAALTVDEASRLVSMTFVSRSGSERPHIVIENPYGETSCSCQATTACHGVKAYRRVKGLPTP